MTTAPQQSPEELDAAQYDEDFAWLMAQPHGRRLLLAWIHRANVFGLSFPANEATNATLFNEGRRDIGISLNEDAKRVAPDHYLQMLGERMRELADRQKQAQSTTNDAGGAPGSTE